MSAVIYERVNRRDNIVIIPGGRTRPYFEGAENKAINECSTFDPTDGVTAYDKDGNVISYTVDPTSIDTCVIGNHTLTYTATQADGKTTTIKRHIKVVEVEAPRFTGIVDINVKQGNAIDLTAGVKAWLGVEEITYTYSPLTVDSCTVGVTTVTYTATGNGKTTTATRNVTVTQAELPTIYGNSDLNVYINTDFDPLQGITATDANGNSIPVELDDELATLTKTVDGIDDDATYIKDTLVPLRKIPLDDRQSFDGWYDNSSYTGSPITEIDMDSDKHVYAKITDLEAYASYDSATKTFRVFTDEAGKYTNGQVAGTITYYADWENTLNALPWTSESWLGAVTTARIDNVIHPARMQSFFNDMSALTTITGLWRIDTSGVASFSYTFGDTAALTKPIDLTTFDTANGGAGVNCNNMFNGSGVTSVNLCGWESSEITNISGMFRKCTGLTTIYASAGFDLSSLGTSFAAAAFTGDTNLVGGQGTTYDSNYARQERAKIDGGSSDPGYFTER